MTHRNLRFLKTIFILTALFSPSLNAQSIGGAITGLVRDPDGAAVPAALVQAVNTATGQSRVVSTNDQGRYTAMEVPPGTYELMVLKGGFNTAKVPNVVVSVAQLVRVDDIWLTVAPVGGEKVEVKAAETSLLETDTPALSTAFSEKLIRDLPILTRDVNNLALLSPGVSSVRTFSFANTLVPFTANGSRGRANNFIIDSVDNNEPLFGGAAAQFTNADTFAEFRIITAVYKAEFGRNSGSVVDMITKRGGNSWHGDGFWFGQRDGMNATNRVEQVSGLTSPAPYQEDMLGSTLGGPLRRDSTWLFLSYQWDRLNTDLSSIYPSVVTLPTVDGLNALAQMPPTQTLNAFLRDPTLQQLPLAQNPCPGFIPGLPASGPCTVGSTDANATTVDFGTYLVPQGGLFDLRDHQGSVRLDQKLGQQDDFTFRYMVDDGNTPLTVGSEPIDTGFFDAGLFPSYGNRFAERSQNAGVFWTHGWSRALHELRGSYSRTASAIGALDADRTTRERLPSVTVIDNFATDPGSGGTIAGTAQFLKDFPSAGSILTIGRDSRPNKLVSNIYQMQDNVSISTGRHSIKFGANFVRTFSDIRDMPSDLGEYFYLGLFGPSGFDDFVNNAPFLGFMRLPNFGGKGGETLPLREFSQFYFFEDDFQVRRKLTLNLGLRYENFGQPINHIPELNPSFGPKLSTDNMDFGPRVGFAWGINDRTVLRGGYGIYYNPTDFDIALLAWQSGPISPFILGAPSNVYPQPPLRPSDAQDRVVDCDSLAVSVTGPTLRNCAAEDTITHNLRQPRSENFALSFEHRLYKDVLFHVAYSGSVGERLFQRLQSNPRTGWVTTVTATCLAPPCAQPRQQLTHGEITTITNGAHSTYHSLQFSGTKRFTHAGFLSGLMLTGAYTYSHMIDNASEITGPEVRSVRDFKALRQSAPTIEVITPFAEDPNNPNKGERGNSSFDRRHRASVDAVWSLPSPASVWGKHVLGGWEVGGIFAFQTGQPFSPLNAFGSNCADASGDGVLTNDRPSIGNPHAPLSSVALVKDPNCIDLSQGYVDPLGNPIDPKTAHFVQNPLGVKPGQPFSVGAETFIAENAGRNTLIGPSLASLDLSVMRNFRVREGLTLQMRMEAYDVLNHPNVGFPLGNVYAANALAAPATAFGKVSPTITPARATGIIPESAINAVDATTGKPLFLSTKFLNSSSRRMQFGMKLIF